jgi:hypothetical protein
MLASALGGTVFLSAKPEVGYPTMYLEDSCKDDDLCRLLQAAFEPSGGTALIFTRLSCVSSFNRVYVGAAQ